MVMVCETLILAVVTLSSPLFGKIAGCEFQRRPFGLVGASGLFFLLTVAFSLLPVKLEFISSLWFVCSVILYFIGWITLFIGAFWQLAEVVGITHFGRVLHPRWPAERCFRTNGRTTEIATKHLHIEQDLRC